MSPKPTVKSARGPRLAGVWLALLRISIGICLTPAVLYSQSADEYRVQINSLVEDGRFAAALESGLRGVRSHPDDAGLTAAVGALAIRIGKVSLGAELIRRALDRGVDDPALILLVADLNLRIGEPERAVEALRSLENLGVVSPGLEYRLAEALAMAGDDASALGHARRAVELDAGIVPYRRLHALLLDRLGREEEAGRELSAALRLAPGKTGTLRHLADREKRGGRPDRALEYLEMAAAEDPENPLFHRELYGVYQALGWTGEATRARRTAEDLEHAFETLRTGIELAAGGGHAEAAARLEGVVERMPQFLTGAAFLAALYRRTGRDDKARDTYERILSTDPSRADVRSEVAWLHVERGEIEEAIELLAASSEESPELSLLEAYRKQLSADWAGAVGDLERAARLYPLDERIMRQLSVSLAAAGRPAEAAAHIEKASGVGPVGAAIEDEARRIRFMRALELGRLGEWEAACRVLDDLVESGERSEFLFHLGYCLQNLGRYEEAAHRFRRGLELQPGAEWARVNLAFCAYHLGLYDEASRQWEILVEEERKPERVYQLGLSRLRQWRLKEGWRLIAEAASHGVPAARRMMAEANRP